MILKNNKVKTLATSLLIFEISLNLLNNLSYADELNDISRLNSLRIKIENDIEKNGVPNSRDMDELEKIMNLIEEKTIQRTGNSLKIDLGKGYSMRLDSPEPNGNPKYHAHVYKGKKEVASENADGTKSHGKTLDDIPDKKAREKAKSNSKWKDYKKKQSKLSEAVKKVKSKYSKSQLKQTQYVKLAKALLIGVLGFALFSSMSSWIAFFAIR